MWQKRTLLLIFACKRPKYADTGGGGSKIGQILRTSFMDGPLGHPENRGEGGFAISEFRTKPDSGRGGL